MKHLLTGLLFLLSACLLHSCKPKEAYQYDKYGMQRMTGSIKYQANARQHYHNNGFTRDSLYALNDTSIVLSVLNKDIVEVAGTRLYIVDEYTTATNVIFVNDTGTYCGPSCHKVILTYNYNANTIDLADGIYNINGVDDRVINYTAHGH